MPYFSMAIRSTPHAEGKARDDVRIVAVQPQDIGVYHAAAEDFQPNRLERTKYAIDKLFDGLKQDRVGLVSSRATP